MHKRHFWDDRPRLDEGVMGLFTLLSAFAGILAGAVIFCRLVPWR